MTLEDHPGSIVSIMSVGQRKGIRGRPFSFRGRGKGTLEKMQPCGRCSKENYKATSKETVIAQLAIEERVCLHAMTRLFCVF